MNSTLVDFYDEIRTRARIESLDKVAKRAQQLFEEARESSPVTVTQACEIAISEHFETRIFCNQK